MIVWSELQEFKGFSLFCYCYITANSFERYGDYALSNWVEAEVVLELPPFCLKYINSAYEYFCSYPLLQCV